MEACKLANLKDLNRDIHRVSVLGGMNELIACNCMKSLPPHTFPLEWHNRCTPIQIIKGTGELIISNGSVLEMHDHTVTFKADHFSQSEFLCSYFPKEFISEDGNISTHGTSHFIASLPLLRIHNICFVKERHFNLRKPTTYHEKQHKATQLLPTGVPWCRTELFFLSEVHIVELCII